MKRTDKQLELDLFQFLETIEKEGCFIKYNDKRLFNCTKKKMGYFWRSHKEYIYNQVKQELLQTKYPFACYLINKVYGDGRILLGDDDKINELMYIWEKDKNYQNFSDGSSISRFVKSHLTQINIVLHKQGCSHIKAQEVLYEVNIQNIVFYKKLNQFLRIIEADKKMIAKGDKRTFDNGGVLYHFWPRNWQKIYDATQLPVIQKHFPIAVRIIEQAYLRHQLSWEDKYLYCLQLIEEKGRLLRIWDKETFKSGTSVINYYKYHRNEIYQYLLARNLINIYPKAYTLLKEESKRKVLTNQERCLELYAIIEKKQHMIKTTDMYYFSDGSSSASLLVNHRSMIYEIIKKQQDIYPKAYQIVMDDYKSYLKRKRKKILKVIDSWDNRVYWNNIEQVCSKYNIDIDKNKDILLHIAYQEFMSKINYLNQNSISLTNQKGFLHPIFYCSSTCLENQYGFNVEQLIDKYFDVEQVVLVKK